MSPCIIIAVAARIHNVRGVKVVGLLLLVYCLSLLRLFCGGCVWSLFCCAVLSDITSFAVI